VHFALVILDMGGVSWTMCLGRHGSSQFQVPE
jgi:hypothetical protein